MDAADPDLPNAAVEHINQMLTLAKRKHQEAMDMLGTPDPSAVPRLREVLRLLEEVELLADDASTYIETDVMKAALKDLHFQQASAVALGNALAVDHDHGSRADNRPSFAVM